VFADPVACIAVLKELGALPDLRILIEAESVLNDGAAIVVFELCKSILEASPMVTLPAGGASAHEAHGVGVYVAEGAQLVLAAPLLGAAFYLGTELWLSHTDDPIQVLACPASHSPVQLSCVHQRCDGSMVLRMRTRVCTG